MLFGRKDRLAIECELTDTTVPYFIGGVRVWFGGLPLGDFDGDIVSTQMFGAEGLWKIGQRAPAPPELAGLPAEACIAELRGRYDDRGVPGRSRSDGRATTSPTSSPTSAGRSASSFRWSWGTRIVLDLPSGAVHEVRLKPGDLDAACLGFSAWVQAQPGYGAGSYLTELRSPADPVS